MMMMRRSGLRLIGNSCRFLSSGTSGRQFGKKDPIITSAEEAVSIIESNNRVFVHSAAATPVHLTAAMFTKLNGKVKNVEVCSIHTEGKIMYNSPEAAGSFRSNNFFVGSNQRQAVNDGRSDFVPIFLSEIPYLFSRGVLPIDVALISVSTPDRHGFCSLGPSVDVSLAATSHAKRVIAQVNKHMPRTHGDGILHISNFDYIVEKDQPLPTLPPAEMTDDVVAIGKLIAELVEDGATLQMGIGCIPDATLSFLGDRKKLGIHTEMFAEGVIDLVKKGVVTNENKVVRPGHIVGSFLMGSQNLFDFVDDNPLVHLYPSEFVNDPSVIKQNPKVVAINSAIEVDITGQICADSIGDKVFSGTGGQVDFERGAALSKGGVPIIALPSRTSKGEARIVTKLKAGAGVTTTRSHAHWIITEYGRVNLWGKNLRQRAELLISIAHPDDRKTLYDDAAKRYGKDFMKHQ